MQTKKKLVFLFLFPFGLLAQEGGTKKVFVGDTIFVSRVKTAIIEFPSEVLTFEVGTKDVQIQVKRVKGVLNLLQLIAPTAEEIMETNLIVVLKNNSTYYFDLIEKSSKKTFYYSYLEEKNLTELSPIKNTVSPTLEDRKSIASVSDSKIKKQAKEMLLKLEDTSEDGDTTKIIKSVYRKLLNKKASIQGEESNYNISFSVTNIVFAEGMIFFKIYMQNRTNIDYDIDYFAFQRQFSDKPAEPSDEQDDIMYFMDMFTERKDLVLKPKESRLFMFAFDQFTLNKEEELMVEIKEKKGERKLKYTISDKLINFATPIE